MKPAYALSDAAPPALRLEIAGPHQETLAACKTWLEKERARLQAEFLKTNDAGQLLAGHSGVIDTLITELFASQKVKAPLAIVAVGGYGRRELFPYSDIDLLFLHEGGETQTAERAAENILYLLWDLGLSVGQSHRSIEEALRLARQDITICTNLLDARVVAGEAVIFEDFKSRFRQEIAATEASAFIEAKLAERDERHHRFGDSRYRLEPNIKEGKGGLRDLQTLEWLTRYAYPVEALKDLIAGGLLSREEYRAFERSRHFLWQVRAHLHYIAGRAEERLTFDRQHALAAAMGYDHPEPHLAILRFMRRYFATVRTVGAMTGIFCALLEDEKKRRRRKPFGWLALKAWATPGVTLEGERLGVRRADAFERRPLLMLEMFRLSQRLQIDIHPRTLQRMARSLLKIDRALRQNPRAGALFLDILLAQKGAEPALRRMSEAGVLGRFVPEFGRIIGHTQFNMYHIYTVDEHTLVAIGILHALENGEYAKELPLASALAKQIEMRRALYVALLSHDLAKGKGQAHSEAGAPIAAEVARRLGLSTDEADTAAWLVTHHLLFSDTALKRDLADPKTIETFAQQVQSPTRLKLLFVLTVADMRAVGGSVWNAWKSLLLEELYEKTAQAMSGGVPLAPPQQEALREALLKALPGWNEKSLDAYLEQGSPGFLASLRPPQHAAIARMLKDAQTMDVPLLLDTQHDYERAVSEITVCTKDKRGLFSKLSGALALAGANIVGAKIFTLKNGMAVDVFQVQDASGDIFDRPNRLAKLSVYIEQALAGELALESALQHQRKPYGRQAHDAHPSAGQVFIENEASHIHTLIEITGHDRPGLLYALTKTMADLDISIASAHISTYGTRVVDVFYVKDAFGMKIFHENKLKKIREELLLVINKDASL